MVPLQVTGIQRDDKALVRRWDMGSILPVALVALLLTGCARAVVPGPPPAPAVGFEETGLASWYGHPYHGRQTASGEVYDMADLTAAHRTLPFGSRLLVTNLDAGQTVEVRVNDRGPFADGRILDLSWGAARVLGAVGPGVIPVRTRLVALPGTEARGGPSAGGPAPPPIGAFVIQLGAFASRERADALRQATPPLGAPVGVVEAVGTSGRLYRVQAGPYPDRATAEGEAGRLAEQGYRPLVLPAPAP